MPRRPATITQADVARTIRAAKQAGAAGVIIKPDGTMTVVFDPQLLGAGEAPKPPRVPIYL